MPLERLMISKTFALSRFLNAADGFTRALFALPLCLF
jgi:hypothetical protein